MIAALPMYAHAENRAAHDALWAGIRDAMRSAGHNAPENLSEAPDEFALWGDRDLYFSQICNLPYRAVFHDRVHLIAAPDYGLPDTEPGTYYSHYVTRTGDPTDLNAYKNKRFAISHPLSQSGYGAAATAANIPLTPTLVTGGHARSAHALQNGAADIATIDAVTWRNLAQFTPLTVGLTRIAKTTPTPGLSFVTGNPDLVAPLRAALAQAIASLSPPHQRLLGLNGITQFPKSAYLSLPIPAAPPTDLPHYPASLA